MEQPTPSNQCSCAAQTPGLGSSFIHINTANLKLSDAEVSAILQAEITKMTANLNVVLAEADQRKRDLIALRDYDIAMSRWYSGQRRYVRDHSPTVMAAMLTHPVLDAIKKTEELYLALHPKPLQPFPDIEAKRRELTAGGMLDEHGDLTPEAIASAREAIEANPERKAFLLRMEEVGKKLREVCRKGPDSSPGGPDPALIGQTVAQTPASKVAVGATPPGSETLAQTPSNGPVSPDKPEPQAGDSVPVGNYVPDSFPTSAASQSSVPAPVAEERGDAMAEVPTGSSSSEI